MLKPPRVRFGIVGAGSIARAYAAGFRGSGAAELAGVTDCVEGSARAFAAETGCASYPGTEAMAERGGLDAAIVCVPPADHESVVVALLERGLHVLCEKPMGASAAAARRMAAEAQRRRRVLCMATKFRFAEDVVRAHEMVGAGALGQLLAFENVFSSRVDMSGRWHADLARGCGGVLMDNGCHAFGLVSHLAGRPRQVFCATGPRVFTAAVEESVYVVARSEQGVSGTVTLSWATDFATDSYLRLFGTEATLALGWKQSKWRRHGGAEWEVIGSGYDKTATFRNQLHDMASAVRGEAAPRASLAEAVECLEAIEASYRALQSGGWERVGQQ